MGLEKKLVGLAYKGSGSFKTLDARKKIARRLVTYFHKKLNIQIRDASQIKVSQIERYIQARRAEGISFRTLQNEMSAIRRILEEAGREKMLAEERMSNQSLGIANAPREGKKTAISEDKYLQLLLSSGERDPGFAACIQLSRELGLRMAEAVRSTQSVPTWLDRLEAGKNKLTVIYGTKGKRVREVTIHKIHSERVLAAVRNAFEVMNAQSGKLIDRPNLKQAMNRSSNEARANGLESKESFHSLRYSFARAQYAEYLRQGFSEKEALSLTSVDLGHGDGRGYYVKRVYLK